MNKRTKACSIPAKVKRRVNDRDGGRCIFCGGYGLPEAHIIPRSHGGLGIEQNIVTACRPCHDRMDNSVDRPRMLQAAKKYMIQTYGGWNENECIYRRWQI